MWRNDTNCRHIFMFPVKNLARKGVTCQPNQYISMSFADYLLHTKSQQLRKKTSPKLLLKPVTDKPGYHDLSATRRYIQWRPFIARFIIVNILWSSILISLHIMLPFELTKDTPYLALSGELWSVFYEYFNRNWSCYKGFLLYYHLLQMEWGKIDMSCR